MRTLIDRPLILLCLMTAACDAAAVADTAPAAAPLIVRARNTQRFVSDETWTLDSAGTHAMPVCLGPSSPTGCPTTGNVLLYNYPYPGWGADLTSVPGAKWIWDARHVVSNSPADRDDVFLTKTFNLDGCSGGVYGEIWVASDDFAEVIVNGTVVGHVGSTTDIGEASKAQISLQRIDMSSALQPVNNVVQVH